MSERGKFEEEWGAAFDGVEEQPSENVWSEVKAEIATLEAEKQKIKAIFWRRIGVAASIAFLALLGGYFVTNKRNSIINDTEQGIALADKNENTIDDVTIENQKVKNNGQQQSSTTLVYKKGEEELTSNHYAEVLSENDNAKEQDANSANFNSANSSESENNVLNESPVDNRVNKSTNNENAVALNNVQFSNESDISTTQNDDSNLSVTPKLKDVELAEIDKSKALAVSNSLTNNLGNDLLANEIVNKNKIAVGNNSTKSNNEFISGLSMLSPIDSVASLAVLDIDYYMQPLPDLAELFKHKKNNDFKSMWAGISMGGGSFNPNVGQGGLGGLLSSQAEFADIGGLSAQENATKNNIITNEATESPAFAYRFSVDFGKQFSRRILIESGVEYAQYSSEATSNLISNKNQTPEAFLRNTSSDFSYNDLQNTSAYKISNNYEYISVPISLGYIVVDKKIGVMLSSGFSADMFLSNTIVDETNKHSSVQVKNGAESPYRPLNVNALFGGEVYYSWSQNYVIAIDPGYRYSLTGITKSDASFSSRPSSFFVALKFKYVL